MTRFSRSREFASIDVAVQSHGPVTEDALNELVIVVLHPHGNIIVNNDSYPVLVVPYN